MNPDKRYKIAYLTSINPLDKSNWSGTHYYMVEALQKHCGDITILSPSSNFFFLLLKFLNRFCFFITRKKFNAAHNSILSYFYKKSFGKKLKHITCDIIFAPISSTEISKLTTKIPILYASDATFDVIYNYYPNFRSYFNFASRAIHVIEKEAMDNASLILYPSSWAANSCINYYKIPKSKVRIIPYGANLNSIPPGEEVLPKKKSSTCKLLLVGVNWKRKGGKIAYQTLMELRKLGIKATLTVCGCIPPRKYRNDITVVPFLNKAYSQDELTMKRLMQEAHFLLFPTRAECYGIVCCEANAYGTPVLTCDTGGVSSVIEHGVNGFILDYNAKGKEYASLIYEILKSEDAYQILSKNSRKRYEERLNWNQWGMDVNKIMKEMLLAKAK